MTSNPTLKAAEPCDTLFNAKGECEQWHLFTQDGIKVCLVAPSGLSIDIGGEVVIKPLRDWHSLAWAKQELAPSTPSPANALSQEEREAIEAGAELLDMVACHEARGLTKADYGAAAGRAATLLNLLSRLTDAGG